MDSIDKATAAFWAAFTVMFPEVTSGDSQLSGEDRAAMSLWATGSVGDNPSEVFDLPVGWLGEERVAQSLKHCMSAAAEVLFVGPVPAAPQLTVALLKSCITHVLHFNPPRSVCKECGASLEGLGSWEGLCYACALAEGLGDSHVPSECHFPEVEKVGMSE